MYGYGYVADWWAAVMAVTVMVVGFGSGFALIIVLFILLIIIGAVCWC